MRTIFHCPCCSWVHDEPELKPEVIDPTTLAGQFGLGVFAAVAISQRNLRIEGALRRHFETHTPLDWIRKIGELEQLLSLERALTSRQGALLYDHLTERVAAAPGASPPRPAAASSSPPLTQGGPEDPPTRY